MKVKTGTSSFLFFLTVLIFGTFLFNQAFADSIIHDEQFVNDHPGYLSAWETHGSIDKVILLVTGFDTSNTGHPADKLYGDYQLLIDEIGPQGWDIILFDYVDGSIDLKINADNLARFIEYLDSQADPNYHLAIIGGSMGGIVARTMFVQEYSNMGAETYVSVDSPHRGVTLSEWVEDLATLLIDYPAAHQMYEGDPAYNAHYGWLTTVEADGTFMPTIIDPMNTCAIALSNGEIGYWRVDWEDLIVHNKWYPVASYVESQGLRSTYMPYHSTAFLDSNATYSKVRWGYSEYSYRSTASRYFDLKIPNPRAEHGAPEAIVRQAVDFALENYTLGN